MEFLSKHCICKTSQDANKFQNSHFFRSAGQIYRFISKQWNNCQFMEFLCTFCSGKTSQDEYKIQKSHFSHPFGVQANNGNLSHKNNRLRQFMDFICSSAHVKLHRPGAKFSDLAI